MPRVIVINDPSPLPEDASILFDERVESVHLSTGHGASQLVERLAWAIRDAERAEGGSSAPRRGRLRKEAASRGYLAGALDGQSAAA